MTSEIREKCMERASRYLAYKPRTRQELTRHLQGRGFPEEEINACADQLEEYNLLNDLDYASLYIETMTQQGRGMERIRRELAAKGVDRNTIEDAIAEMEELPDEEELALEQAARMLEDLEPAGLDFREREKIKARIARRLAGRGFRTDTIYRAVRQAMERAMNEEG
ncbi:MAG: regulatory protein RecX [Firmicutes bacterium]|nr:regulatory protein RecX [Bacillota bacterium]MBQ9060280.1 regulatory protein RecX [Bacillota bacterium]